jgi:hypothetical protein
MCCFFFLVSCALRLWYVRGTFNTHLLCVSRLFSLSLCVCFDAAYDDLLSFFCSLRSQHCALKKKKKNVKGEKTKQQQRLC